jgi:predicted homoserine dehydrogenase-like protein
MASFVDASNDVEMTSLGNAIGFVPDVRGMHGPEANPKNIAEVFAPKSTGGVLENTGVVDYALGIAPGVFVVFTTDHPKIIRDLKYLSMGPGPCWALYRPYHLTSLETPISIARAVLKGESTIATDLPPVAETVTAAKRDLKAGEKIDALGVYCYGMIDKASTAQGICCSGPRPGARWPKICQWGRFFVTMCNWTIVNYLPPARLRDKMLWWLIVDRDHSRTTAEKGL